MPAAGFRRFIHAFFPLGPAGHVKAVGPARALAAMAQDDGGAYLFMLVQEHAFAGDGDACEAAALVASGFGDEDDAGLGLQFRSSGRHSAPRMPHHGRGKRLQRR